MACRRAPCSGSSPTPNPWYLEVRATGGHVVSGHAPAPTATLHCRFEDWVDIVARRTDPRRTVARGRLRAGGSPEPAGSVVVKEQGGLPSRSCASFAHDGHMPSQASPRVWFEIDTECDPIGGWMHVDDQAPCSFDSWLALVALIEQARARPDLSDLSLADRETDRVGTPGARDGTA